MKVIHPWQTTPTELIKQAIDFLLRGTETDRQISFLLFDVSVETLFKTFLSLPKSITGLDRKYYARVDDGESNFYTLVDLIRETGGKRLTGVDLEKVKYYHSLRNRLYHQGDGVVPKSRNLEDYANIVVELLDRLLSVDLKPYLFAEKQKQELSERRNAIVEEMIGPIKKDIQENLRKIKPLIVKLLEDEESEFVKKSFTDEVEEYIDKMSSVENKRWRAGISRLLYEGFYIIDDDNKPVNRYNPWNSYDFFDFIQKLIIEEFPGKPFPEKLDNMLAEHRFGYVEWTLAEILIAEDFTEFLLRITALMRGFPNVLSADDYLAAKHYPAWNAEEILTDNDFDSKLANMIETGQQILAILHLALKNINAQM